MTPAGRMDDHRRQLGRGFNWLGGATVIAKVIDFATVLVMLLVLTREQVGVASIVVSVGTVIEALNGLGTSEALIQARTVSRRQLDTLFWYVVGAGTIAGCLTLLAAPAVAAIYGIGGMGTLFLVIALKQPLVGAALIPLALMNRDLQYGRIAAVNVCATLAAALTRLGLGLAGAGAWALVAGYATSGLYVMAGALAARPFRPRLRFRFGAIRQLARFGLRAAAANVAEQAFKNIDYLLIGRFYGAQALAIYRVAFDIAMEPATAVGTLVSRTALPVVARVSAAGGEMTPILAWALRRIIILVAPLTVATLLVAGPLTSLIHDAHGNSYAAAATPLRLLAAAALLRVAAQLLSTVLLGSGRPGTTARLSAATLLALGGGILAVGLLFKAPAGLAGASAVWLGWYPLLLAWEIRALRRHGTLRVRAVGRAVALPCLAVGLMLLVEAAARRLAQGSEPRAEVAAVLAGTILAYAGAALHGRRRHPAHAA